MGRIPRFHPGPGNWLLFQVPARVRLGVGKMRCIFRTKTSDTRESRTIFATKVTDNASNSEPDPTTADVAVLVNTVENSPYTCTLATADAATTYPMTSDLDVLLSVSGAMPGLTITVSRNTDDLAPAGLPAAHVINECLAITGSGLGASWTATLTWPFDPASDDTLVAGRLLDSVFQVDGGSVTHTYTVTPSGNVITITGITSFSDWFAGSLAATRVEDWTLMK